MKIGVITDCFQKTHFEGIEIASELGLDGVQIYATTGEFSPETLTPEQKDKYKKLLKESYKLDIIGVRNVSDAMKAVGLKF